MRSVVLLAYCYLALVLQASAAPELAVGEFVPSLLAMALVIGVARFDEAASTACAAGLGFLADCLGPTGVGVEIVAFTLMGVVLQQARRGGIFQTVLLAPLVLFVVLWGGFTGSLAARSALAGLPCDWNRCLTLAAGNAGYTVLLGIALLLAARGSVACFSSRRRAVSEEYVSNRWRMLTQ